VSEYLWAISAGLPVFVRFEIEPVESDEFVRCWQLLQGSAMTPIETVSAKAKHFAKYIIRMKGRILIFAKGEREKYLNREE
jgi:hypothetical protein